MSEDLLGAGTVLDGKWRIDGPLGKGGMGAVYAATHVRNGSVVALKVLHREIAKDKAVRDRFLLEGYAANSVEHAGTVRVLDDGTTADGLCYLVMERLRGRSLDAIADASGGRLPLAEVLRYGLALLDIIAAAHDKGIVHRDIKPENVMICDDGTLKVLDFGLARIREQTSKARLTVTGVPMGTPAFMPPEQAMARWDLVDARSDVYSLGATLFNLLTGELAHDAQTVPELLVRVSTQQARSVQTLSPQLPPTVAAVIDRALAFDSARRWPNARAMLVAWRATSNALDRVTLGAGALPTTSILSVPRPAPVDVEAPTMELRAIGPRDLSSLPLMGVQTTAPVSSSPETRKRRSRALVWALPLIAVVGGAGGVIAYRSTQVPHPQGVAPIEEKPQEPRSETPLVTAVSSSARESAEGLPVVSAAASSEPSARASSSAPTSASARVVASGRPTVKKTAEPSAKPTTSKPGLMGYD